MVDFWEDQDDKDPAVIGLTIMLFLGLFGLGAVVIALLCSMLGTQ